MTDLFKLSVAHIEDPDDPAILEAPGDTALEEIHNLIQHAFCWDSNHLYAFFRSGECWDYTTEYAARLPEPPFFGPRRPIAGLACETSLGSLRLAPGTRFLYLFDYGDEHCFTVEVLGMATDVVSSPVELHIVKVPDSPLKQYHSYGREAEEEREGEAETLAPTMRDEPAVEDVTPEPAFDGGLLLDRGAPYPWPLDRLLTLGDPDELPEDFYATFPVTREDAPALAEMARDRRLALEPADQVEADAPTHAVRLLVQLEAGEAVAGLVPLLNAYDKTREIELSDALELIGAPAIPRLRDAMRDGRYSSDVRSVAANTLATIAVKHEETAATVQDILVETLGRYAHNPMVLNTTLAEFLLQRRTTGILPLLREAYAAHSVSWRELGRWKGILAHLGASRDRRTNRSSLSSRSPRSSRSSDRSSRPAVPMTRASRSIGR
ncbi:MAG: hypothetical protein HYV63_27465 [Candidatus Schekmanbacteria bacterium]|nr:hypothetical protein [Candidatus Schekmanbacteria bacterium]